MNREIAHSILLLAVCGEVNAGVNVLSSNGYSGIGLIPASEVIQEGISAAGHEQNIPGAKISAGSTTQVGFGLGRGIELVGKLASNDPSCNMFVAGACPAGMIRDFSGSLKWQLPQSWLEKYGVSAALGVTDIGGAATNFRSYYWVASKKVSEELSVRFGTAQAKSDTAYLRGGMAAIDWAPLPWTLFSLQRVGQVNTAHAAVVANVPETSMQFYASLNQRLNVDPLGVQTSQRTWLGLGLSMPLDTVRAMRGSVPEESKQRQLKPIPSAQVTQAFEKNGFYGARTGWMADGTQVFEVENTAYAWNAVDAAGVALGVVAAVIQNPEQKFELRVKVRGITEILVRGPGQCLRQWLEGEAFCEKLQIQSALQRVEGESDEGQITWNEKGSKTWEFRPELQISPVLASTIGTEYGDFDADLGANVNLVVPLWKGATLDVNKMEPVGLKTKNFEPGGVYYGSRIQTSTTRRMLHQLLSINAMSTQLRLSVGTVNNSWDGRQIETQTLSQNGRHKWGVVIGRFEAMQYGMPSTREYQLGQYRYNWRAAQSTSTEITAGKYWGGDTGYTLGQRFWFGDTSLAMYLRRTRMNDATPLVSFAGVTLSIPLTPRQNVGYSNFMLRGTPQWSYTLETKVMDKDNRLTAGYGQVPSTGETLSTTFNRDRNSSAYFDAHLWRMKEAFLRLYRD